MFTATKRNIVIFFVPTLLGGGAERNMAILAKELFDMDIDVRLVLAKKTGPYLDELPKKLQVVDLKAKKLYLAFLPLSEYLRKTQPFAIISTLYKANVVTALAIKMARVSSRFIIRESTSAKLMLNFQPSFRTRLSIALETRAAKTAHRVIVQSHTLANEWLCKRGLPQNKIAVIPNPALTSDLWVKVKELPRHPWFLNRKTPIILGVGRLVPPKDFATLISAFAIVAKNRPCRLIILGDGTEKMALQELIRHLGIRDLVDLPGFVNNPFSFMAGASVFVLSSLWEGQPNALIQAMACGLPIVATDCPNGARDILSKGKIGILVPPGDAAAMAKGIETLLDNPTDPKSLIDAVGRFDSRAVAQEYVRIIFDS